MSDGVTVKVTRADELFDKLRALAPETQKEIEIASRKGAEEVASAARALCNNTRVKATIQVEPAKSGRGYAVVAGDASTQVEVRKGSGVMWNLARGVEFGIKKHILGGIFKGARHPGVKAQPFLFPAFRILKKRNQGRIGRAVSKAAKQVAGK